ncbi:tRNA (guanosine(37)-N1)-methyltransferase TrmD, partial [Pseudoalteromonas sp. S1691]
MTHTSSLWVGVIRLFPDRFDAITHQGVTCRSVKNGLIDFNFWNQRDYELDKHITLDHRPDLGCAVML